MFEHSYIISGQNHLYKKNKKIFSTFFPPLHLSILGILFLVEPTKLVLTLSCCWGSWQLENGIPTFIIFKHALFSPLSCEKSLTSLRKSSSFFGSKLFGVADYTLYRVLGSNLKTSPTTNLTGQSNIALIKKVAEHFFKDKLVTCPFIQEELVGNLLYCWNEPIFLRIDDKQLYLGV